MQNKFRRRDGYARSDGCWLDNPFFSVQIAEGRRGKRALLDRRRREMAAALRTRQKRRKLLSLLTS